MQKVYFEDVPCLQPSHVYMSLYGVTCTRLSPQARMAALTRGFLLLLSKSCRNIPGRKWYKQEIQGRFEG